MNRRFCIAPMMDWTDRHDRYFLRQITHHAVLYTEMVTSAALLKGDRNYLLGFHEAEHPLALQLGGSDPGELALCARMAEDAGYDEVNLNVGCPSDRVKQGRFGACLMATPDVVADCVAAIRNATSLPVTVKHRIGIDDQDIDRDLENFVVQVSAAGCHTFVVHARKAWLKGLNPKQNRDVPPLDYTRVYRLKAEHPDLEIIINGGIRSLDEAEQHLQYVDGVMMGREAYQNPYILAEVDQRFYGVSPKPRQRDEVVDSIIPYIEQELGRGTALSYITRHMLGLYQGQPGAKGWRRTLSEQARHKTAGLEVLQMAQGWVKQ